MQHNVFLQYIISTTVSYTEGQINMTFSTYIFTLFDINITHIRAITLEL